MKKQTKHTRFNALFLCLALLLCSVWFPTSSTALNVLPGVITPPSGLPIEDDPYILNPDVAELHGHVERLYDKETSLDTLTFRNDDGTVTTYFFTENVKYVASDGSVKDKSNKLYSTPADSDLATLYAHTNSDNDVNTYFPASMSGVRGIMLNAGGRSIQLIPVTTNTSAANKVTAPAKQPDYVMYPNVFGQGKHLRYSPTFSGFKEDIILDAPTSESFSFILKTGGLIASLEYGEVKLHDSSGNLVAYMGQIYAYDSFTGTATDNSHVSFNSAVTLTQTGTGDYLLTITPDQNFIYGSKTVYPVYIDPDITVYTSGTGNNKTIVDVPIYNGTGTRNMATGRNTLNLVGYVGSVNGVDHGVGRTYIRFPGLLNDSTFKSLPVETVSNISLYLNEVSGKTGASVIRAYQYTGTLWEDEENDTYNDVTWYSDLDFNGNEEDDDHLDSATISSSGRNVVQFDLTDQLRNWRIDPSTAEKGIFLAQWGESNASSFRSFAATEYATDSYRPYITVKYADYLNPFYSVFDGHIGCVYTNSPIQGETIYDDGLQYRANCYGYALRMFKRGPLNAVVDSNSPNNEVIYSYYQYPGDFLDSDKTYRFHREGEYTIEINNGIMNAYLYDGNGISTLLGTSLEVVEGNMLISNEEQRHLYLDLITADMAALGYTVTEVDPNDVNSAISNIPTNKRLILLVTRKNDNDGNFHFYMQHSDGTWSHKNGYSAPSNISLYSWLPLTNQNIVACGDESPSSPIGYNTNMIFFYVDKPVTIDYTYSSTEIPHTTDMAGDIYQNARALEFPLNWSGTIDYCKDIDFYTFTAESTGSYKISSSGNANAVLKLYNSNMQLIATGTGTTGFNYSVTANAIYYLSVETTSTSNPFTTNINYTLTATQLS